MPAWDRILTARPDIIWYPTTCNNLLCGQDETGLEHVEFLNRYANVQIAVADTGIDMFAVDEDERGYILGREYGWNYKRIAGQVDLCVEKNIAMIWGVYEPGHLRVARHYVDREMFTKGSNWNFYFVGKYGLTSVKPIGTCGMEPSLESLYYYLTMIEEAKHKDPWFISIWGEGSVDTRPIIRRAIELGGHIKTGPELHYDPDRNPTNLELLQKVQEIAREVGRPLATHEETRGIYGIKQRTQRRLLAKHVKLDASRTRSCCIAFAGEIEGLPATGSGGGAVPQEIAGEAGMHPSERRGVTNSSDSSSPPFAASWSCSPT